MSLIRITKVREYIGERTEKKEKKRKRTREQEREREK